MSDVYICKSLPIYKIKDFFPSRYVLCTVSFLRTWMPEVSLLGSYAFKRYRKVLYLQQFRDIASFYTSIQCCLWETWCWSYILSFYVMYFCILSGRLSLIFLNSPSMCITQVISCFSFLGFMSQPFQCKGTTHTF